MKAIRGKAALCSVALALLLVAAWADRARAAELDADTMRAALRTTPEIDDGFIADVLDRVHNTSRPRNERLPASMVYSSFQWARKKTKNRFQYFRAAMIVRAKAIGVALP